MSKPDAVTEAMRGTEAEIANSVFDAEDADESTDRSLEEMDPEADEPEEVDGDKGEGEAEEAEGEGDQETADAEGDKAKRERDEGGRYKPAADKDGRTAALRDERGKRQAVETERDQLRTSFDALNARLENLNGQIAALTRTAPKQEARAPERPDPIVDPDGYARSVRDEVEATIVARNVEETFRDAHEEHGQKFETAYRALTSLDRTSPSDRATVQRISRSANPGRALMKWHEQQEAMREIGGNPTAYRERLLNQLIEDPEVEKVILNRVRERTNQGGQRRPNNVTRLPSLNSSGSGSGSGRISRGADPRDNDDSEAAVVDYAFRD